MLRRFLIAATAVLSIAAAPALAASPYTAIYSFGDSLSDVGNVYLATGGAPAYPYVGGQFSNGPVWVQDMATALGLPALTPSLAGGNDYAYGGATTGYPATNNPAVPNLAEQIATFSLAHSGVAPSSGLYTFSIGSDDLFGLLKSGLGDSAAAQAAAAGAAAVVAAGAGALELAGAKNLILFDVPDLGKTPYIKSLGSQVSADASKLSLYFDQQVLLDLAPVEAAGLKVFDLNAYALLDEAVGPPPGFGLTNVTDPCWTGGFTGPQPGDTLCSTDPAIAGQYLFWDGVHPTAAGHELIAEDALGAIPEPSAGAMVILGFAGLGALGARRIRVATTAG